MLIIKKNGVDRLVARHGMGGTMEIFDIEVYSERGKGIGSEMLNELLIYCKKNRIKRVFAFTRIDNGLAEVFYERNNFVRHELPRFYPDGDGVIYIKEI